MRKTIHILVRQLIERCFYIPDDESSRCLFTGIFIGLFSGSSFLFDVALLSLRQPLEFNCPSTWKNLLSFVCLALRNFFTVLGERGEQEICTSTPPGLEARFNKRFSFVFFAFPPFSGANRVSSLLVFAESHCPQPSARLDMIFSVKEMTNYVWREAKIYCYDSKWRANLNSLALITH